MLKDSLVSVSPPMGTRAVRVTRSTLRDPMTDMTAGLEDIFVVGYGDVKFGAGRALYRICNEALGG